MVFIKKIPEYINQSISKLGIEKPIFCQKKSISSIKSGADTLIVSEAKSGKSTAMAIALTQKLEAALNDVPRALVVVPDKESADALYEQWQKIAEQTNLRMFCVYRGPNLQKLKDQIYFGSDIVIGTARQLNELYSNNGLNLNDLKYFVIDDADTCFMNETADSFDRLADIVPKAQRIIICQNQTGKVDRFIERHTFRTQIITPDA